MYGLAISLSDHGLYQSNGAGSRGLGEDVSWALKDHRESNTLLLRPTSPERERERENLWPWSDRDADQQVAVVDVNEDFQLVPLK